MNKGQKILSIFLGIAILIYFAYYLINLIKEKKIFGNRTKQQFKKLITEAWKTKYFEAMRNWIRFDNPDNSAKVWAYAIQEKAVTNGTTFERQREIAIKYLWDKNLDNQLYVSGSTKWNNTWAKDTATTYGADVTNPLVIQALSEIHKR